MSSLNLNVQTAQHLHKTGQAQQLHGSVQSKLIKAAVYGANDGIVTTFAVVAGVAGAGLSPSIILILGFANLIGDGLSMGIGDFLGERSEQRYKRHQYLIEKWEVEHIPEEEAEELKAFFVLRGVKETETAKLVEIIRKYPNLWSELGFFDEMGQSPTEESNLWHSGLVTIVAFATAGSLPLLPYVLHLFGQNLPGSHFYWSILSTAVTLFVVGSSRTLLTKGKWWINGLEMLGIGALAAGGAYITGAVVKAIAG